jgi:hypothetical protein
LLFKPNPNPDAVVVEKGTLFHLMYCVIEGTRTLRRIDVRMAEEAMIKAMATSRTRDGREREEATVVVGGVGSLVIHRHAAHMAGGATTCGAACRQELYGSNYGVK